MDWDAFRAFAQQVERDIAERRRREAPELRDPLPDLPGGAPSDKSESNLPLPLHALVGSMRADLEGEIRRLLDRGQACVTLGLGPAVDVPLLRDDILAARVRPIERSLLVVMIRHGDRGYAVGRDSSNFGVFWRLQHEPGEWHTLRRYSYIEGLHPGDVIGLGSCPADAVTFALPARSPQAAERPPTEDWRCEGRLRVAVDHWRYADITLGGSRRAIVRLDDPRFARVALMLSRNLDEPSAGFRLRVLNPGPGVSHAPPGALVFSPLVAGDQRTLTTAGHHLYLGDLLLPVPAPVAPTPRFSRTDVPTTADILDVLELGARDLDDAEQVRARYRELARRYHPDRNGGNPGHTSRFIEVQACWEAWQATQREG